MGESNSKWNKWPRIYLQNTQAVWYQKNKQPNQKAGRRLKQTFLQTRYTDGLQTHEKMLNSTHRTEMQIKTIMRYHLTLVRMAIIEISMNNKCWKGCGEVEPLLHCWQECKLIQPLWITVWRFLKKLVTKLPSVQFRCSAVSDCLWPHELQHTNSRSLLKPMFIESVMPSSHLILCCPLLLLPSIFSSLQVFSDESVLHIRWPKYWSFSFNISPSNEHPGLISFRMDWLDLLAFQGTLKSLPQHHSSKASTLWHSAFFSFFFF